MTLKIIPEKVIVNFRRMSNPKILFITLLRLILAIIFLIAGIAKLISPHDTFLDTVTIYYALPKSLSYFIHSALPWVEVVIGCLLITGLFRTVAFVSALLLIATFIGANTYSFTVWSHWAELGCGCFGKLVKLSHLHALLLNGVMVGIVGMLLLSSKGNKPLFPRFG